MTIREYEQAKEENKRKYDNGEIGVEEYARVKNYLFSIS